MIKNIVSTLFFLLFSSVVSAQCAMCRAVVEQGNAEMAEGVNSGIVYLMIFPYLILGTVLFFLYKKWKKKSV